MVLPINKILIVFIVIAYTLLSPFIMIILICFNGIIIIIIIVIIIIKIIQIVLFLYFVCVSFLFLYMFHFVIGFWAVRFARK
jgi:hypothetical protein